MHEIGHLAATLRELMVPVQEHLKEHVYWNDCAIEDTEYKSRDGFIPYAHNCGGIEVSLVIPKCEEYSFPYLEFGECDECKPDDKGNGYCGYGGQECTFEGDGHLDAKLRVWLKFEGLEGGVMKFWLYAGGGNGDAPYFRTKYEHDIFKLDFEAKTIAGVRREGAKAIAKLLKKLK
jgi:hypothetical protein